MEVKKGKLRWSFGKHFLSNKCPLDNCNNRHRQEVFLNKGKRESPFAHM
jgi:hypothetical protein